MQIHRVAVWAENQMQAHQRHL
nr:unnamed protein product [Callosobruchus chinensis]